MAGALTRSDLRDIRTRMWLCIMVVMLSVRTLNPAKLLGDVLGFPEEYLAPLAVMGFFSIFIANGKELSYYMLKIFFKSIFNIFFSSIEILGKENIPPHGPVIFSGNHMNQFVDGGVALVTCPHKLNFLVAASSFKMFIIGSFARLMNALPIHRPIDAAVRCEGELYFDGNRCYGRGTQFSKIDLKDKIRPMGTANIYKIVTVISDTECILGSDKGDPSPQEEKVCQGKDRWTAFDRLKWVDQSGMFTEVHTALQQGESVIIFPEGGSHDNTDLLPLKVGVASIAFGTLEDGNTNVSIVPVGLNYFRGHRFRGRVVVEYGAPIHITKELAQIYKENKREAYQLLLAQVAAGMRSTLVTADSYDELKLIHTARRLYQRSGVPLTTKTRQDLARRFATAHHILKEKFPNELPADLAELERKLDDYQETLTRWGIYDYQVNKLDVKFSKLLYVFVHGFIIIMVSSIPSIILNAPVGIAAKWWAEKQQVKALAKSRVKIAATDVLLSNKIIFSIGAVPTLWMIYAILLYFFSGWEVKTVALVILCFPIFSYIGIKSVEAGMVDLKDLRPAFLRLLPSFREQAKIIPQQRASLRVLLREAVKKYGPPMGPLYYEKDPDEWEKGFRSLVRSSSANLLSRMSEEPEEQPTKKKAAGSPRRVSAEMEGSRVPTGIDRQGDKED